MLNFLNMITGPEAFGLVLLIISALLIVAASVTMTRTIIRDVRATRARKARVRGELATMTPDQRAWTERFIL